MSLEAALDEERREIMNILEGRPVRPASPSLKDRRASPAAPVRSMLDVSTEPRHGSIAGIGVGVTAPPKKSTAGAPLVRSLLDPSSPPPARTTHSATTSPTTALPSQRDFHRSSSDAANHPPEGRRRGSDKQSVDIDHDYHFEMLPTFSNQALPKRVTQGGKKGAMTPSAMAAALSGADLGSFPGFNRGRDTGRHNSTLGIGAKSKSPSSRLGRSQSPRGNILNTNSFNPMPSPGTYVTDAGKVIDLDKAYRRLSDAAFLKSGNSASRNGTSQERTRVGSGESLSPTGGVRLDKDYYQHGEDDDEAAIESSEDEDQEESSGDEEYASEGSRGRRRNRRKKSSGGSEGELDDSEGDTGKTAQGTVGMGRGKGPQKVQSLLAAAEEERMKVESKYKVKSLLEPSVTITSPSGERLVSKKSGVHPQTSFDHTASRADTPADSDHEDNLSDFHRAQRLAINVSPVDNSIPHRVIRTILRGEFSKMQHEAEEGLRRQRMYLVATDLSDEAVYALEWTIGTILRDGDTLFAVYAVDEETGTGKAGEIEASHGVQIGEGAKAMQDSAAIVGSQTEKSTHSPTMKPVTSTLGPTTYLPATETDSHGGSVDSRSMSKAELERYHAIEDISNTCVRLLRKTQLQVRVAVEVIHCKSPKHMITEAIDGLEPTLVILGSRGRSALKGVLLGSFSNYLVTKSSVPVMVARKKLKKHAKYKNANIRLSNNLTNPKKLATAKID